MRQPRIDEQDPGLSESQELGLPVHRALAAGAVVPRVHT